MDYNNFFEIFFYEAGKFSRFPKVTGFIQNIGREILIESDAIEFTKKVKYIDKDVNKAFKHNLGTILGNNFDLYYQHNYNFEKKYKLNGAYFSQISNILSFMVLTSKSATYFYNTELCNYDLLNNQFIFNKQLFGRSINQYATYFHHIININDYNNIVDAAKNVSIRKNLLNPPGNIIDISNSIENTENIINIYKNSTEIGDFLLADKKFNELVSKLTPSQLTIINRCMIELCTSGMSDYLLRNGVNQTFLEKFLDVINCVEKRTNFHYIYDVNIEDINQTINQNEKLKINFKSFYVDSDSYNTSILKNSNKNISKINKVEDIVKIIKNSNEVINLNLK